ncbi:hypothetical protein FOA52_016294 [Chlamydomonas sp. UWO 241]|nr:hypothetical protein FOA52_016294 [Chlamydomonas sp. UWO 241]
MQHALSKRVALIQGPPGTGKTYVVADAIVRLSEETILCVCYTNHALDQFREALLDKGIMEVVRIGGASKSARLQPFNLWELMRSTGSSKLPQAE